MTPEGVGHYIREWRIYCELAQAQLATKIGVSQSNINHIENGKTAYTQTSLEKTANALKVSPATLLSTNPFQQFIEEEEEERSPFMAEVESLLSSMRPLSRKLVRDFMKSVLEYERTDAKIREGKLRGLMVHGKLSEDFRV